MSNPYGFKSKVKWAIVETAPLSPSGLNEIKVSTETKKQAVTVASALGLRVTGWGAMYEIVKLPVELTL